ncbi:MAG: 2Fe-2S iron-sulfur cluster binding domain-containing protein [Proteobacteria bacterium]|nr:2Fe-2S iron-sulfur cluster binding domain-containing protein [Pseudomonadota bacterium]MBI3499722.1 2Fe-2S iron-sulfur cluster binding domain-containing protein [Pseudomonadota bacterium]
MAVTVTIRQWPEPIAAEPDRTILEAALAAGVPYPHGCRSGTCGACKSLLVAGEVILSPYSKFALSEAERRRGLILACRARAAAPVEVAWLEPPDEVLHPVRLLGCRVVDLADLTHDIKRVTLAIETGRPFTFAAGQYASLTFPGQAPRDYSMANRPSEARLDFHIRRMVGGAASRFVTSALQMGDGVGLEGPFGQCYLREAHRGPILALAGGSGLAPIKSIVETALAHGQSQPIHLYFGVRSERDLYLEEHFRRLARDFPNLTVHPVLSEPEPGTLRRTGMLHQAVAADFADLAGAKAYVAGPPVMVEAVAPVLLERGLRSEDLHADPFTTEADKAMGGRAVAAAP